MSKKVEDIYQAGIGDELKHKFELPERFRNTWLQLLRSDEFGQARNELTDGNNNYCCLGVACKAAGYSDYFLRCVNDDTGTAKSRTGELLSFMGYIGSIEGGFNLKKVPKVLHGSTELPGVLSSFNDDGYSFKEIADFIERNTVGV